MGVALVMSECFGCKRAFMYNPIHVPSLRVKNVRQPVCLDCVNKVNPVRIKNGLAPIIPHRDAYEPCDESELPHD